MNSNAFPPPHPEKWEELLIRVDERTKLIIEEMKTLKFSYVRKEEFEPVKRLVYGLVGLILISVGGAVIALVLRTV